MRPRRWPPAVAAAAAAAAAIAISWAVAPSVASDVTQASQYAPPCIVSGAPGEEILGRLALSPACASWKEYESMPLASLAADCLECVPVLEGLNVEVEGRGAGEESAQRWGEDLLVAADSAGAQPEQGRRNKGERDEDSIGRHGGLEPERRVEHEQRLGQQVSTSSVSRGLDDDIQSALVRQEDAEGTAAPSPSSAGIAASIVAALIAAAAAAVSDARDWLYDALLASAPEEAWSSVPLYEVGGGADDEGRTAGDAGERGALLQSLRGSQASLTRQASGDAHGAGAATGGQERASRALQEETPAPTAVDPLTLPPAVDATDAPAAAATPAPSPTEIDPLTPAPAVDATDAPVAAPSLAPATESEAPAVVPSAAPAEVEVTVAPGASTIAPVGDETPAPAETLSPEQTLSPGATMAPVVTRAPSELQSLAPTEATLSPLADGETRAPTITPTTLARGATTASPAFNTTFTPTQISTPTEMPTPAPTGNTSTTEEVLDATGDVATGAVAVGVAATAAVATVTTVTATTAATTAAAGTTVTSTVTTVASTAATAGGGGGGTAGGGAGVGAAGTTTSTTTAATTTNAGGFPDGVRTSMQQTNYSSAQTSGGGTTTANQTTTTTMSTDPASISARSPSAAMGVLMIFQMQFVSLLRLMETNITDPFMDFLNNLKWLNLHFEIDFSFLSCSDEDVRFEWSNDDNGTWALNTFLVFGLLLLLIFFHVILLSYLEASWLSRANAIHRHRLQLIREHNAEEAASPFDGNSAAAYARYLDAQNQDRELYEQEKLSAERYLRRHNSVWLYFPHVELLFLLFAYQGASAAEARLIYSGCFPLVVLGICALAVFPLLMMFYVNRIVWSRLRPAHSPLRFAPNPDAGRGWCIVNACCGICNAWRHGTSMFSWADKGQWTSKNDEDVDLDSRKFRIGFEPLFVDYTQKGTLYISFLMFEWFAFGLVSGFVTDGTAQTAIVFVIYLVDFLILLCLRPFSNSIIQFIAAMTVLSDALTVALMCYASLLDPDDSDDSDRLDYIYAGALIIQTWTIILFIVPLYVDAFICLSSALCAKTSKLLKGGNKKEKAPIKGSCGETMSIFCALLRENFIGCVKSTWRGPTYKVLNKEEEQRRRASLLQPVRESQSEEELEFSGVAPPHGRVSARGLPEPRNRRITSSRNSLQDFSDHGPHARSIGATDSGLMQRGRNMSGRNGLSRGSSSYGRAPASDRR